MGYAKKASVLAIALAASGVACLSAGAAAADGAGAWAGPYVGLETGGDFATNTWKARSVGPNNVFGINGPSHEQDLGSAGVRLGGYAGWNLPVAPNAIVGLEADIAGIAGGKKTYSGIPGINYQGLTSADSISAKSDWDASVRARAGLVVDPALLVYGTVGMALRQSDYKAGCPGNAANSWCGQPESASVTKTQVGWTAGAGAEGRVADKLSLRVEYRYAGFSSTTVNAFQSFDVVSSKVDPSSHMVTLGLTYHFGH